MVSGTLGPWNTSPTVRGQSCIGGERENWLIEGKLTYNYKWRRNQMEIDTKSQS